MENINYESLVVGQGFSRMNNVLGHIRGKVTDIDGYGLKNSRIWVRETGLCAMSDACGNYVLINNKPGIYSLVAECQGYSRSEFVDAIVEQGDNPGFNFVMFQTYNRLRQGRRRGSLVCPL